MGDGRYRLLKAVEKEGSLSAACKELGISYRHAWGQLKKLEQRTGIKFVASRVGGRDGGKTELTPEAVRFLVEYEKLRADIEKYVQKRFQDFPFD